MPKFSRRSGPSPLSRPNCWKMILVMMNIIFMIGVVLLFNPESSEDCDIVLNNTTTQHLLSTELSTDSVVSVDNKCCIPCTFPANTCCLQCKDVSVPREHELLMASMEGLTVHVMKNHKDANDRNKKFMSTRAWAGNSHIGNRDKQATYYYDWIKSDLGIDIQHVCEIGMNGGHSAFIFLAALSTGKKDKDPSLTMFDFGEWSYSTDVASYLEAVFPRRFQVYYGDSTKILPEWMTKTQKKKCDIFSVDGNHSYKGTKADILNAAKASTKGGQIILDDMDVGKGPRKAFDELIQMGVIENPKCVSADMLVGYDDRYDTNNSRSMKLLWCTATFK